MATGKLTFDEGTETNVGTYVFTEDAVTKHVNRSVLNDSSGAELGSVANPVHTDPTGDTDQPVTIAALPLPTGAATSAKQDTIIGYVDGIETALASIGASVDGLETNTTGLATSAKQDILLAELELKANLSETQPVSAASLPLPTGAATEAKQDTGNAFLNTLAGAVAGTEVQVDVLTMPADVDIRNLSQSSDAVLIYGSDDGGTTKRAIKTDAGGAIQIDLEVAAVTANAGTNLNTSLLALEAGGNLAAIKAKTDNIPALGQALAAASVPVILPSATITTLTPPAAITNFANETGGNLAAIKAKTDNIPAQGQALAAASLPVVLTAAQITTLTPPAAIAGFATSAKQDTGNASVASIDGKLPTLGQALAAASIPVILPSATIATLTPPAAITGFATSAKQDTLLTELQGKADLTETQPVSLASVPPHAVTNAGIFAVQSTDSGAGKTLKRASVALAASGNIVALVSSKRIKVYSYQIQSLNDTMSITIKDGSGGATLDLWTLNAREGTNGATVAPPSFIFATTAGTALYGTITGTGTVNVSVSYWDDDAS